MIGFGLKRRLHVYWMPVGRIAACLEEEGTQVSAYGAPVGEWASSLSAQVPSLRETAIPFKGRGKALRMAAGPAISEI